MLPPLDFDATIFGYKASRRVQRTVFWVFMSMVAVGALKFAWSLYSHARANVFSAPSSETSSANVSDSTPPSVTNILSERVRFVKDVQDSFPGGSIQFTIVGPDSSTLRVFFPQDSDYPGWADPKTTLRSVAHLAKQKLLDLGFQKLQLVGSAGRISEWSITSITPDELTVRISTDTVVVFVSVDAMNQFVKLVNDGIRDAELLNPLVSCRPMRGDGVALLDVSYRYYSEVAVTSGRSFGCKGWIVNEDLK